MGQSMSEIKRMPFTKAMKKTHTILMPQMLEYHSPFLQAAFEANGYHFAVLQGGSRLKERALRCMNNDYCYPGILIVGQMRLWTNSGNLPEFQGTRKTSGISNYPQTLLGCGDGGVLWRLDLKSRSSGETLRVRGRSRGSGAENAGAGAYDTNQRTSGRQKA